MVTTLIIVALWTVAILVVLRIRTYVVNAIEKASRDGFDQGYNKGAHNAIVWSREKEMRMPMESRLEVQKTTARYYANVLNDALRMDPEGIRALFRTGVKTTQALLEHPTFPVQVYQETDKDEAHCIITPIGIVNALLPVERGRFRVAAQYDPKTNTLMRFAAWDIERSEECAVQNEPTRINLGESEAGPTGPSGT
jgi:hypothetical protein